jgi:hypothetical protein|tara:strand:+ start:2488 stop:2976 length:489 start_codon:yes stop_codon:yes gene_type:complete
MKNFIALVLLFVLVSFTDRARREASILKIEPIELKQIPIEEPPKTEDLLIKAIIFVESSGNDSAYCKVEDAVGCLQIRRVMVREVNRILKKQGKSKRYKLNDRWKRDESVEMFNIYIEYYKLKTPEDIARSWNGGPRGSLKNATISYWNKVKKNLTEFKDNI